MKRRVATACAGLACIGGVTLALLSLQSPAGADVATSSFEDLATMHAADCGRCHEAHLADHERSAHANAFDDVLFQREWRANPEAYCIPCHSPRTSTPLTQPGLASAGVDCVSCHVRGGAVLASTVSGRAPHRSRADPGLTGVDACARCHQIDVPHRPGVALQDTVGEWRAAGEPGTCQSCHMEARDGRHRHDAPGGYDRELLSRALTIAASATHEGWGTRVELEVEANEVGHAVPTGDIFRRLVVRAWDDARPDDVRSVELGRHLGTPDGRGASDERVPPPGGGARDVTLRLRGRATEVRWAVELWSLPRDRAARTGVPHERLRRVIEDGTIELTR